MNINKNAYNINERAISAVQSQMNNYGFRATNHLEQIKGSPPFVFDHLKTDSPLCIIAKNNYNEYTSKAFEFKDYTRPIEAVVEPFINKYMIKQSFDIIKKECENKQTGNPMWNPNMWFDKK